MYHNVHLYKAQWDDEFTIAFHLVEKLYAASPDSQKKRIEDIAHSIANKSLCEKVLHNIQAIMQKDIKRCDENIRRLTPIPPNLKPISDKNMKSLQTQHQKRDMIFSLSKELLSRIGEQKLKVMRLAI